MDEELNNTETEMTNCVAWEGRSAWILSILNLLYVLFVVLTGGIFAESWWYLLDEFLEFVLSYGSLVLTFVAVLSPNTIEDRRYGIMAAIVLAITFILLTVV